MLNNITTDGVYKVKQTAGRIAAWLYALSDYKSYDSCESTAKHLFSEFVSDADEGNTNGNYYYNGYTMFYVTQSGQAAVTFLLTDSDFVEKNGGDVFEYATGSSEETEDSSNADDTSNTEESATAKSGKVSDSEIKKAEELLKKEPFGTDEQSDGSLDMFNVDKDEYYGRLNVYDAIHYYLKGASLEAQRNPDGSISMKYTATSNGDDDELTYYSEGFYVTYIVNIDDGTVCYDDDTLHNWEINKGYYSIDLVNELSNSDN